MTATELPPMASRKMTKRAGSPPLSGTLASVATASVEAEHLGAPRGDEQIWLRRPAQFPERRQLLVGHPVDRQGGDAFTCICDDDRPCGAEFGKATLDRNMFGLAERDCRPVTIA